MNERLKEILISEGLSQVKFAEILGLNKDHINKMISGKRAIVDRTIKDICYAFNINREWFETGNGAMYIDPAKDLDTEEEIKDIIRMMEDLDDEDKIAIKGMIKALHNKLTQNKESEK